MTRHLAVEWGPQNIRVNSLAPGLIIGTEGFQRLSKALRESRSPWMLLWAQAPQRLYGLPSLSAWSRPRTNAKSSWLPGASKESVSRSGQGYLWSTHTCNGLMVIQTWAAASWRYRPQGCWP